MADNNLTTAAARSPSHVLFSHLHKAIAIALVFNNSTLLALVAVN